ncbi:MAG: hypothetical protein H6835_14440 [Planctomycetes bacterium]|nr:hypothetical protein [Planctomycetota bacterium]
MPRPLLPLALAVSLAACAGPAVGPHAALRRMCVVHATTTFATAARIEVIVMDANGGKHNANGEVARGGTTRGLCESLLRSLAHSDCVAHQEDAVMSADPLERAMQQNVLLPLGWRFLAARCVAVGGRPIAGLTLTLEATQ